MTWQTRSTGSAETEKLGELMGRLLSPPLLLELSSDLGGGKTTFVRGLARGIGSKDAVTSPTFTLNQIYKTQHGIKISHNDFYRLNEAGIMSDELAESLADEKTITIIEWGNVVANVLSENRITVEFKPTDDDSDTRDICLRYPEGYSGLIKKLETNWVKLKQ